MKTEHPTPTDERSQNKNQRRRAHALRNLAYVAGSYGVDTLLLVGFALAGTVPFSIPLGFALSGAAACLLSLGLIRRDITLGDGDRNLSALQMALGTGTALGGILLAPKLTFLFLNILFITFAFGTLRLGMRQALLGWLIMAVSSGTAVMSVWSSLELPHTTRVEVLLVIVAHAFTLLRFMATGLYGTSLRRKVNQQNKRLAEAATEIARLANHDDLTGALNRRGLFKLAERDLALARRNAQAISVILFDLDHFKSINDSFGHAEGDRVLAEVAEAVRGTLRGTDLFGRIGGEEFLVVLPNTPPEDVVGIAESLRNSISNAVKVGTPAKAVTASFGVSGLNRLPFDLDDLQKKADEALYQAKADGRNRVCAVYRQPPKDPITAHEPASIEPQVRLSA